ncbi:MAG: Rrf2 family transcriptional regulator [Terrimonas sp.]|nr:Rrf2 family transcriptional regulator [Terrimonas sp.]
MILSKTFGYAIRGILYIALVQKEERKVQIEEISEKLSVPRHFLGKILQELVRNGLLTSVKGPNGGFSLGENTLSKSLLDVYRTTDHIEQLTQCELRFNQCDKIHPCPLHDKVQQIREEFIALLSKTTINDLITGTKKLQLHNIATTGV